MLSYGLLGKKIQQSTHSSVVDAQVSMLIFIAKTVSQSIAEMHVAVFYYYVFWETTPKPFPSHPPTHTHSILWMHAFARQITDVSL